MNRLIIDTDAGVDDAQAIMMALAHPDTSLEAITMVTGNVHVQQVAQNVPKILDVCKAVDIPFFIGADLPLVAKHEHAEHVHGNDGLGNANLPASSRQCQTEHAVLALIRLINQYPNEITLLAIGPLTNLALAVRLDPTLPQKLKRFIIMGGTIGAHGNSTAVSEYNFFADPEAVQIVLDTFGAQTPYPELISWETTLQHSMAWDWYDTWVRHNNERSRFIHAISQRFTGLLRERGINSFALPDPLAMAITLEPEIVSKKSDRFAAMELTGTHSRGQLVVDWRDMADGVTRDGNYPNMTIIQDVDMLAFQRLLDSAAV